MGSAISSGFGSQGPQGPVGPQGPIGLTGPAGSSGLQNAVFLTSSQSWVCPEGVTKILLTLQGGGGGGGSCLPYWNGYSAGSGNQGLAGDYVLSVPLIVTPGTSYYVTIGGGGPAGVIDNPSGTYQEPAGHAGGVTSFSNLVSVAGGSTSAEIGLINTYFGRGGIREVSGATGYGSGGYGGDANGTYMGSAGMPGLCFIFY